MQINENLLKITGGAISISELLDIGNTYRITMNIDIVEAGGLRDRHDGTFDFIIKAKHTGEGIEILDKQKRLIEVKEKKERSKSQKLRGRVYEYCQEQGIREEEDFYNNTMTKLILYFDEIINFFQNKT